MNANDQLREYQCTENYYRYGTILITDGALALAKKFECFWFLDIISSYQRDLKDEEFQVWKLTKNEDNSALVTCTDGNDRIIKRQRIEWTDFSATQGVLWIEAGEALVCLLPSEH